MHVAQFAIKDRSAIAAIQDIQCIPPNINRATLACWKSQAFLPSIWPTTLLQDIMPSCSTTICVEPMRVQVAYQAHAHSWWNCNFIYPCIKGLCNWHRTCSRIQNSLWAKTLRTMRTKALIPARSTATRSDEHGPPRLHTVLSASCLYKRQWTMYEYWIAFSLLVACTMLSHTIVSTAIYHQTHDAWSSLHPAISCTRQQRDSVCMTRKARVAHITSTTVWTTHKQLYCTRPMTGRFFATAVLSLVLVADAWLLVLAWLETTCRVVFRHKPTGICPKPGSSHCMSQESVWTAMWQKMFLRQSADTMSSAPEKTLLRIRTSPDLYMQQSNTAVGVKPIKQLLASLLWCG